VVESWVSALRNTTGTGNTAIGFEAGINQTTGDDNIYVDNDGVDLESDTIRIGDTHLKTFIAGNKLKLQWAISGWLKG